MLEKPDIQEEKISACLQESYGLHVLRLTFLPLGADVNAAVYRAVAERVADGVTGGERVYFVKLRRGLFDEIAVTLPKFLSDQGIEQIIAPIATTTGRLWATLGDFTMILYPFVEGHNGYEITLSDRHWGALGTALKRIHTAVVPPVLLGRIPQERYSPQWRESVKRFLVSTEGEKYADPVAVKVALLLQTNRAEIENLIARTEQLALALEAQTLEFVVCHADLHAGNVLLTGDDTLSIVDWDNPILAPKERDLMFIGGGLMGNGRTPQEEEILFYATYGPTSIDWRALAYYRYERIIQDIAAYCEQLLLSDAGGEDREQSFYYLASNFLPDSVLTIAYQSDKPGHPLGAQALWPAMNPHSWIGSEGVFPLR